MGDVDYARLALAEVAEVARLWWRAVSGQTLVSSATDIFAQSRHNTQECNRE